MKIFLDTNIFVRFLMKDSDHISDVEELIDEVERGRFSPYSSSLVLLEMQYVLTSKRIYNLDRKKVISDVRIFSSMRGMMLCEECNCAQALRLVQQKGLRFADALIATQVPKNVILCTYDRDFQKVPGLQVMEPAEVLRAKGLKSRG